MKKAIKLLSLILVLILALTSCGIGGKTETDNTKENSASELPKVAFICKSYADTFTVWVKDEVERIAKQYDKEFTVESFDSKNNSATQIEQIENCIALNFDVIIFQQVDAEAPVQAVKKAVDAGISVIVTTGSINDDGESVYIDANPVQQGEVLVKYAIDKLPQNAKIGILQGPAGNFHANGRDEGFKNILKTRPDIEITVEDRAEWAKDKAMNITQNWLAAHQLDAIFAHNDDMALGAIEAIKLAGKQDEIQVYGIDATPAGCEAVKDGSLGGTVFQNAITYAEKSLEYASKILKNEKVESVRIDSELVTKDNVQEYLDLYASLK